VRDVDAGSVRKKMKDKAFARAVSREMMLKGAEELAFAFEELTTEVIVAMSDIADRLGLAGTDS
jgi:predicted hydrolase (HD superfamily)